MGLMCHLEFLLGFLGYVIFTLFLLAYNHIAAKTLDWNKFFLKNIRPSVYSFLAGSIIYIISVYLPEYSPFLEQIVGGEIQANHPWLFGAGTTITIFIKGALKVKRTKAINAKTF